jgi:hypothetical protein
MPANYVLLAEQTVSQTVASVTFSNIPQTGYTDLKIVGSVRSTNASTYNGLDMTFNGSTTGYSSRVIEGGDGNAASFTSTGATSLKAGYISGGNATANSFGVFEIYIPNYTSSNSKSMSIDSAGETNATTGIYMDLWASLWANSAAINSVTFTSTNIAQYSTFYIYGIAALNVTPVIAPKATGGDIVVNDGTYWYHAFLRSGIFTPSQALSCDILQVAGGGGGGGNYGAGGGAGGLLTFTSQAIAASAQTVTIGAGGVCNGSVGRGFNGSNSQFASLTASVGGGAGGGNASGQYNGAVGGSGGGGGGVSSPSTGGAGTAGQGNAGANQTGVGAGSGGGGAGAAGSGVNAGIGATSSLINAMGSATTTGELSGGNYYYAGGGLSYSAGTRGLGGGAPIQSSGTANTGGGGGGDGGSSNSGGSGIVVVRYTIA